MDDLERLISQAQKGDKDAFGEIYNLFLKRIFRFIYYLVRNWTISQDLTQNTFLRAWQALAHFSPKKGTMQAFLFTIARNQVIDYQRAKKFIPLEKIEEPSSEENLEEKVVRDEERKNLYRAIGALEEAEKQLIILRYFEELSFREMAAVVGESEGTIRVRTHRILKKLRQILEVK